MGDRTDVTLTVLTSQIDAVVAITGTGDTYSEDGGHLTHLTFYEVNYGKLSCLTDLQGAGIAYDSAWGSGSDYGPGTESCRFTPDGLAVLKDTYDGGINPDLSDLILCIDSPVELRQYILDHQEKHSVLTWDSQEEYGKVYRMMQLITT